MHYTLQGDTYFTTLYVNVGTTVLSGCIDPTTVYPLYVVTNPASFTITSYGSSCSGISITPTPTPTTPLVNNIVASGGFYGSGSMFAYNKLYWSHNNGNTWSTWNGPTTGATYSFPSATIINGGNTIYSIVGSGIGVNEYIYVSYDAGTSFSQMAHFSGENINHIVCSKLGQYVVAVGIYGVYMSINYGLSFSQVSGINYNYTPVDYVWNRAAISLSGQYIAIVNNVNNILYQSSDYGSTWTTKDTTSITGFSGYGFNAIAMSADGTLRTATSAGEIYVSTNSGSTWTKKQTQGLYTFTGKIGMSSDGKYQIASTRGQNAAVIQRSTDYGQTWSDNFRDNTTNSYFTGVSVSPDGATMVAVNWYSLRMYRSTNYGNSWQVINLPNQYWFDIDMK